MTDELHDANPVQQDNPGQQSDNVDWRARFTGASTKINELVAQVKGLEQRLAQQSSEMEQLRLNSQIKTQEDQVALSARDQRLQEILNEKTSQDSELARLRALARKQEVALKMGKPELLALAKHIPDIEDETALETIMGELAGYGDAMAKRREEQLLSGVTMGGGQIGTAIATPASPEAWRKAIENEQLHSPERKKLLDEYGEWLNKTYGK